MNNGVILAATAAGLSTLPALAGLLAAPLKRKSFFGFRNRTATYLIYLQ